MNTVDHIARIVTELTPESAGYPRVIVAPAMVGAWVTVHDDTSRVTDETAMIESWLAGVPDGAGVEALWDALLT